MKRQFWLILSTVFLGYMGISIPYLIFPALFINPAYSILPESASEASHALFLGITLAAYPFGQFIGSPILGALSDDYGRKKLLSYTLLITAFCYLATGFAIKWHQLGLLIVSRFMAGFMEGNIAILRAMAADVKAIPKEESLGKLNATTSIAYLIGPLLGGVMADSSFFKFFTPSTPFYVICAFFCCAAGLSAVMLKDVGVASLRTQTVWERLNIFKRMAILFTNKKLQFLMATFALFTIGVDIFYEFGPVYLTIKWTLGPSQLVLYNGVLCLGLAIGNGWLPTAVSKRIPSRSAIIYAVLALALLIIGVASVNSPLLMAMLWSVCGLVIGLAMTLLTVNISDSVPDTIQGEVMGVQLSLRVLGDALICLFGSALLLLSPRLILILSAAMSVVAIVYYVHKIKNPPRSEVGSN